MTKPWLTIIGIGADGLDSLASPQLKQVENADIIITAKRIAADLKQQNKTPIKADIHLWPVPFDPMFENLFKWKGKNIVILATGDPLWHGVGSIIARKLKSEEYQVFPSPSAYSLAAARLGWPISSCELVTLHGYSRPSNLILPFIQPDTRLICLTGGNDTVFELAHHLTSIGYGLSPMTVLENMGDKSLEKRFDFKAQNIPLNQEFAAFNTIGIQCVVDKGEIVLPRTPGLPDSAFRHDGQLTKQHVRAVTGCALSPSPGQLLWDIGAGCGSIAVEWMRQHLANRAIAFETNSKRINLIETNAELLGTPYLKIIKGNAPQTFKNQPAPDAVFIGGGITVKNLFEQAWKYLKPGGILVANAVTNESRSRITSLQEEHGGTLTEIAISSLTEIGTKHTMKPALPVLQWRVKKS